MEKIDKVKNQKWIFSKNNILQNSQTQRKLAA